MNDVAQTFDNPRDRHLFAQGPKRMLALDGGGVRRAITVAFLERIEEIINQEQNSPVPPNGASPDQSPGAEPPSPSPKTVRLGDWFDLIGGTSTGAIIAGALALGHTTADTEKRLNRKTG